jgi:hypothetical protein
MVATKDLLFRRQRFAARTGKTSKTSILCAETMRDFLGNALLPKSEVRQIFVAKLSSRTEPFTLNLRQTYGSTVAELTDESQTFSYTLVLCCHCLSGEFHVLCFVNFISVCLMEDR